MPSRFLLLPLALFLLFINPSYAAFNVGPEECSECHKGANDVWESTPHAQKFDETPGSEKAEKILAEMGLGDMDEATECMACHFTQVKEDEDSDAEVVSGPSCESCHGASSEWLKSHSDFGVNSAGESIELAKDEDMAHRVKRLSDAKAAGRIDSLMPYKIASNCMNCHGLSNTEVSTKTLNAMLKHEHAIEKDFEIIKYSQGRLHHKFETEAYENIKPLSSNSMARLFIGGQMATLVQANAAKGKSDNARFVETIKFRISSSTSTLKSISTALPALNAFLANPNDKTAQSVVVAMKDADLSDAVKSFLPSPDSYKPEAE